MYGHIALDRLEVQIKRAASQLNRLTRSAVERDGLDSLITKTRLFTPEQEESLHATLSATIATGDLLARSVIARRADQARRRHRVTLYSEIPFKSYVPDDLKLFSPKRALEYFTKLVPSLTLPADWEQEIERSAFTAVAATSQDVLERIRDIIIGGLTRGEMDGPQTIRSVLEKAGMMPNNPQYGELIFRTNIMDAHSVGHDREMQDPEMRELFPAWLYSATIDEGSRPWHARKNDRMYEQRVPFVLVRGITARNVVNCRCMPIDLDKWEVSDRLLAGERLYTGVEP